MTGTCKGGEPHDLIARSTPRGELMDYVDYKWEVCQRCAQTVKWKKDNKGRVDNNEYLKAHIRNFCQPWGATRKEFMKIYHPQTNVSKLCLDPVCSKQGVCPHVKWDYDPSKKAIDLTKKGTNDNQGLIKEHLFG